MTTTRRVPREGLADLLDKLAEHARTYVMTGLSVSFDGTVYRVVVEGEGELIIGGTVVGNDEPDFD